MLDSSKWLTILVHRVIGKPHSFEARLCNIDTRDFKHMCPTRSKIYKAVIQKTLLTNYFDNTSIIEWGNLSHNSVKLKGTLQSW